MNERLLLAASLGLCACAGGAVRLDSDWETRPRSVLSFLWARELTSYDDISSGVDIKPPATPTATPGWGNEPERAGDQRPEPDPFMRGWTGSSPTVRATQNAWRPEELAVAAVDAAHGRLFVGSVAGFFRCLRLRDGEPIWTLRVGGPVASHALYVERLNLVFFGADDGHLYAVDAARGRVVWRYATKGTIRQLPIYEAGVVYFSSSESRVYAVEARTGRWRWHYERGRPEGFAIVGDSGVALARGRVFAGFSDGVVVALDARTGDVLWLRSLVASSEEYVDTDGTPLYDEVSDTLFVGSYSGGMYALDAEDGGERWRIPLHAVSAPRIAAGRLYFSSATEGIWAADLDGRIAWHQSLLQGVLSTPLVSGSVLFVSASERGLYAIHCRTGKLLALFTPGDGMSAEPIVAGGRLYVLSNRGRLYAAALNATP